METLVKINSLTVGRDKIARLLQYLSRILWHRLQQNSSKDSVNHFKNLEFQLSTFRKLLRFGRCIDSVYSATSLWDHPDPTVRTALILSKISNALFLLADHFLWLGRADVCTVNTNKWSSISNKYWLYSITMNLVRDFYDMYNLMKANEKTIIPKNGIQNPRDLYMTIQKVLSILQSNRNLVVDLVKNSCDFFIPLNALGHVQFTPGTIGWLGVVSSLAGLLVVIDPSLKLTPS